MLLVPCTCGAQLRVKDEVACHRVKCPRCNAVIRAPRGERQQATATAERQPKAETTATQEEAAPLDLLEQLTSGAAVAEPADLPLLAVAAPPSVNYARDPKFDRLPRQTSAEDIISGPRRGFLRDAGYAFIFPIAKPGNILNLLVILVIAVLPIFIPPVRIWLLVLHVAMFGLLASAYMNVVIDTAAGSDELGRPNIDDGFYPDLLRPALLFAGTFVVAMLPTIAYFILAAMGMIEPDRVLLYLWLSLGVLLWPMMMLIVSLDALHLIVRLDLIFTTIAKTILPYLLVCGLLFLVTSLRLASQIAVVLNTEPDPNPGGIGGPDIALKLVLTIIGTYFSIVCMRMIGLYYLHYKQRFTFELE